MTYYDVEKANFDGSPDRTATENYWREVSVSTFLVADSQDIVADNKGKKLVILPELNFYTKSFASDSHKIGESEKSAFQRITRDIPVGQSLKVDRGWSPQYTVVEAGQRKMYFVIVRTFSEVEKRVIGKETIVRKRGFKNAGAMISGMNEDQWYDPSDHSRSPLKMKLSSPEPKWNRRTTDEIQNFLWESPF
ncbi:MAG: hypothetical protein KF836_02705 [Fimbriimonadaceae bacterium]|nr:hypothetical protein [Fimbriimonadaceae bacterium]